MLKDKYNDLLKEQKAERQKLKEEIEIQDLISVKTPIPFKTYISNLWNIKAQITFKDEFRQEGLNKIELNKLLKEFKPINMFLCGGNSFRPSPDNENEKNKNEEVKQVNPYIIKYNGFDGKVLIEWFSKLKNQILFIKANISHELKNEFLSVEYERKEYKGYFQIENVTCHINGNFADGEYKTIRWGRGSEQYPNDFTIYTENLNTDFKDYLNT